jgi:antitoxin MazE
VVEPWRVLGGSEESSSGRKGSKSNTSAWAAPIVDQQRSAPNELTSCVAFRDIPSISGTREIAMQVQVARWGNSLGLRIPRDIAQRAGLREGTRVEISAEGDRIVITPARPRYVLADLLKGMTPQAMRDAFDWGPDKGREIVE